MPQPEPLADQAKGLQEARPLTTEEQLQNLVETIPSHIRNGLAQAVKSLRQAGDHIGAIMHVGREMAEGGILAEICKQANIKLEGTCFTLIQQLAGWNEKKKVANPTIPGPIASDLEWIRGRRNIAAHETDRFTLTVKDAELALEHALTVLRWFYCEWKLGPGLKTIVRPPPLPAPLLRWRGWRWAYLSAAVAFLLAIGLWGLSVWWWSNPLPRGAALPGETMPADLVEVNRPPRTAEDRNRRGWLTDQLDWFIKEAQRAGEQGQVTKELVFISDPLPRCRRPLRIVCDRFADTEGVEFKVFAGIVDQDLVSRRYLPPDSCGGAAKEAFVELSDGLAENEVLIIGLLIRGSSREILEPFEPGTFSWRVK